MSSSYEAKKARERKRYAELKKNPEELEKWRQKQQQNHLKRIELNKVKRVTEMNDEEKQIHRRKVLERVRKHRQKTKGSVVQKENNIPASLLHNTALTPVCDILDFNEHSEPLSSYNVLSESVFPCGVKDLLVVKTSNISHDPATVCVFSDKLSSNIFSESMFTFGNEDQMVVEKSNNYENNIPAGLVLTTQPVLSTSAIAQDILDFNDTSLHSEPLSSNNVLSENVYACGEKDILAVETSNDSHDPATVCVFSDKLSSNISSESMCTFGNKDQMVPEISNNYEKNIPAGLVLTTLPPVSTSASQDILDFHDTSLHSELLSSNNVLSESDQVVPQLQKKLQHSIKSCTISSCCLCEKLKEKEHMRYEKRKENGKILLMSALSENKKQTARARNRNNTQNFRTRKLLQENKLTNCSQSSAEPNCRVQICKSRQKLQAEKMKKEKLKQQKENEKTEKLLRRITYLEKQNKSLNRKKDMYRKRSDRLYQEDIAEEPEEKVRKLTYGRIIPRDIKDKLIEGEVMKAQLVSGYQNLKSYKDKRSYSTVVRGDFIKKHKLLGQFKGAMLSSKSKPLKRDSSLRGANFPGWREHRREQRRELVRGFLERDENSKLCPDLKQTITRFKEKKQKRYQNKHIYELFADFEKEFGKVMGRSTFYKLKPFWVVPPKVSARDTCLCKQHENMRLMLEKLHTLGVVTYKTPNEMTNDLCCANKTINCLSKICEDCKGKEVKLKDCDLKTKTYYLQWGSKTEKRISVKTKKEITVRLTVKFPVECTIEELINTLNSSLPNYLLHERNIIHQFRAVKGLKLILTVIILVLHVDFAENWNCKYAKEIHSVHFGASRNQISLHTGMMYSGDGVKEAFCSISESLRHDPIAIFAHLRLVIQMFLDKYPMIKKIHCLSDGPSTQYKNKTMFGILATTIPDHFPSVEEITWNFWEPGHGKGAPDGVGHDVKDAVDQMVAHNEDIPDYPTFAEKVTTHYAQEGKKVKIIEVKDVDSFDSKCFKLKDSVPGHKKIRQVTWSRSNSQRLFFNYLSCFECQPGTRCSHYFLIERQVGEPCSSESQTVAQSDDEEEENDVDDDCADLMDLAGIDAEPADIQIGEWVAVLYTDNWYPGTVEKQTKAYLTVKFMERRTDGNFHWPAIPDVCRLKKESLIGRFLNPPEEVHGTTALHIPGASYLDSVLVQNANS